MYHILHCSKQCKVNTFCKMLVAGSAPQPLKTRACALWLVSYGDNYLFAGFSIMIEYGTRIHTNCITITEWLWGVLQITASLQLP